MTNIWVSPEEKALLSRLRQCYRHTADGRLVSIRGGFGTYIGRELQGSIDRDGFRKFNFAFNGTMRTFQYHRILFAMEHGWFPAEVSHKNGLYLDNRIDNLISSSVSLRGRGLRPQRNNKSGCSGVYFHAISSRWCVSLQVAGKRRFYGGFKTKEEAIERISKLRKGTSRDDGK